MSSSSIPTQSTQTHFEMPTLSNGRYQIQGCIGVGGMAAVFKAYDTSLKIDRALKILKPEFLLGDDVRDRFQTEAVAMANLKHPNIVQIYDLGLEGMTLYIVMEYIPYGSAKSYVSANGKMTVGQAAKVCLDIARALEYAHEKGFIHRDVKPDNILLTAEGAQLSDFGIAKDTASDPNHTRTRAVMGTLQYMSPEQRLNTKNTTVQTDIYALVATFYNLMTLDETIDLFIKDIREEMVEELSPSVQQIIHKGCCAELDARYASTSDLIVDLETLLTAEEVKDLQLTPIQTPDMKGTNLEQLKRVWEKYTSEVRESNDTYTHSPDDDDPTKPWQMEATAAVEKTWNNGPMASPKQKQARVEELPPPQHPEEPDTLPSEQSPTSLVVGAVVVLVSLFLGFQWNDFAVLSLTTENTSMIELEAENPASITEFEQAKRFIMDGQLMDAGLLLSEFHTEYPSDPIVHNLYTLTMILQGFHTLPPTLFSTSLYSYAHPNASSEIRKLFQLLSKSWDPQVPRERLEESWLKLIEETKDPLIELNYLVAMRYKMGADFDGVVQRYAQQNPRLGVVPHLQILADRVRGNNSAALEAAQAAVRQYPGELDLVVQRAELLWQAGKKEVAADSIQQVLATEPTFGAALSVQLAIQHDNGDESGFMETFSKSLGDTIPTTSQLNTLYRAGELHFADRDYEEARKHWDFCANQAVGFQNNYFLALGTSKALEAEMLSNPDKDWKDEIAAVATVLDDTALHFVERKRFNVYLQYLTGLNAFNVGDMSTVESTLTEMETVGTVATFGVQLPGLKELKSKVAM